MNDTDKTDAAQDILDAVKNNDAEALSLALERHYELCESGSGPESEPEDANETPSEESGEAVY